jgi:hypothetical protein
MNPPPLLLGGALLFWGWQTGLWLAALPVALALECARLTRRRWDISRAGFTRVVDLCGWGFVAMGVYLYLTRERTAASMLAIAWLPLCYAPLLAAQAYSAQGRVEYGSLFLTLRNKTEGMGLKNSIDLRYPFFALCIFSAAAANMRTPAFYLGTVVLSGWALVPAKPKGTSPAVWAALLAGAAVLGCAGQAGLHGLQGSIERTAQRWVFGSVAAGADPWRSRTAIGSIGALQQSGEILLRVRAAPGCKPPELLREAAYDIYFDRQWNARSRGFHAIALIQDGVWQLAFAPAGQEVVAISAYLPRGQGLLALPHGSFRVEGLPSGNLTRGDLGAVRVTEGPGLAEYLARFDRAADFDTAPGPEDLLIPSAEKSCIEGIAGSLALRRLRPAAAATTLARFFQEGFAYSVFQRRGRAGARPLEDFLLRTRSGHCEYFATATVLLLRAAGIPARYAVGYSVQEFSRWEGAYVVRQRHAHAWAEFYADGRWQDLDTTPVSWLAVENGRASWWEGARDGWAWLVFRVSQWRWSQSRGLTSRWLWLLAPLLLIILWRLRGIAAAARALGPGSAAAPGGLPGRDSELYLAERRYAAIGQGRRVWETWSAWVERIAPLQESAQLVRLRSAAALHRRYRFDPEGLDRDERKTLGEQAGALTAAARDRKGPGDFGKP